MQRKTQKWTVIAIITVICVTLIGSSFVAMFQPEPAAPTDTQALEKELQQRKLIVEALNKKLEEKPEDVDTQIALGDAYYEKSRVSGALNVEEYQEDLQKAIDIYQKVLTKKDDNAIKYKLATSAFLIGNSELADKTYNEILQREPENVDALYGYGMFLFYDKQDYNQAEANWQKALSLTTDELVKKRIEEMITLAQEIGKANENKQESK